MKRLSHLDDKGRVSMVDVTAKDVTTRYALAGGTVSMKPETFQKIMDFSISKGNVLETARIAGIMAAKKTWDLIPLCHPLDLSHVAVSFFPDPETHTIRIEAEARLAGRTGVEMEALTAVAVAGLAIYDMCKAVDRGMVLSDIRLLKKTGGKSGDIGTAP